MLTLVGEERPIMKVCQTQLRMNHGFFLKTGSWGQTEEVVAWQQWAGL